MKQEYKWDAETGTAQHICTLNNGTVIVGEAFCHKDDEDLMNKNTGFAIAEMRSYIKSLQNYKNNILRPELNSLKQLYYSKWLEILLDHMRTQLYFMKILRAVSQI